MERRTYSRQRTLKTGKIIFNQRSSVVDCTVRNLSTKGALLQTVSTLGIPNDFDLVIEPDKAAQSSTSYQAGTGASELAKDADPDRSPARSPAADPVRA